MATRPIDPLIYDRTLADVRTNTDKGNYNASDLNRIESWMQYLKELLAEYGYYANIQTKTDWVIGLGKPNMTTEINRIKTNLQTLKDVFYVRSTTPEVPSTTRVAINYVEANNIEQIINDIEYLINSMSQYFVYSGVSKSGQSHLWQNRFRRY